MGKISPKIACFGEVLWDMLPSGKVAGGAPMNVAFHANQLGIPAQIISSVGNDDLGNELSEFLVGKGIDTRHVQNDNHFPTGTVNVILSSNGSPTYEIITPVAWDHIQSDIETKTIVSNSDAFVFGSLSARSQTTRNTLLELLNLAKLKVFDVNLRSPFYTQSLLLQLLDKADIVKMNDEELETIGEWLAIKGPLPDMALQIKNKFDFHQLIVTRGAKGAWLFHEDAMISSSGSDIQVQDTIGCGDAFLAAFLTKHLRKETPKKCLQFASLTGAYVATQKGGTPDLSEPEILKLTNS